MESFQYLRNTATNRKVICEEIKVQFKLRECLLTLRSEYFNFPLLPCKPAGLQVYNWHTGL